MRNASMRARLLSSFVAVAVTGAVAFTVAVRVMVPRLFDEKIGVGRGAGGKAASSQHEAVVSAVNAAMVIALSASVVCSTVIAVLLSRRTLRHLDALRVGTRRLAEGHYDARVGRPPERELAALSDDFNHLAAALSETEQRRGALIGDVAHEMRTPLTTISGYVEGFNDGLFSPQEMAATVTTEVTRLHQLARDLAAVSRAEEGQLSLHLEEDDLGVVISSVGERLRPQFDAAGVVLVLGVTPPLPAMIDRERMVQAVTNLLGNALAYTPAGGQVTVAATVDDTGCRVAVTDTGRGLRPEDLERVFERFYRADPHDHTGGTGIGLTISRAIIGAHGGELTARSPGPGRGATFEFFLPAG